MKSLAGLAGIALIASLVTATEPIPFDSPRWQIEAEESRIEEYKGKTSLLLRGGLALVSDAEFTDGVIEYFCAFPDARAFVGATWRVQDAANREEFYIRPHQSGNPDANQYTPVFNGLSAWQLYHGEGYGVPVAYEFDTWFPVKIVVSGDQAEVYIGDLEKPALFIDDLKREKASGAVGLAFQTSVQLATPTFASRAIDAPELKGRVERERTAPAGAVMKWQVSVPFAEKVLENSIEITPNHKSDLSWTVLKSEPTGLANLSRVSVLSREANTVFAKVTVVSDRRSNRRRSRSATATALRLFFNDRLSTPATTAIRTRDYRYLGTIGYFDAVTLPLQKGKNELWFAVSESFGGWGVQAAFEDADGLTFVE